MANIANQNCIQNTAWKLMVNRKMMGLKVIYFLALHSCLNLSWKLQDEILLCHVWHSHSYIDRIHQPSFWIVCIISMPLVEFRSDYQILSYRNSSRSQPRRESPNMLQKLQLHGFSNQILILQLLAKSFEFFRSSMGCDCSFVFVTDNLFISFV